MEKREPCVFWILVFDFSNDKKKNKKMPRQRSKLQRLETHVHADTLLSVDVSITADHQIRELYPAGVFFLVPSALTADSSPSPSIYRRELLKSEDKASHRLSKRLSRPQRFQLNSAQSSRRAVVDCIYLPAPRARARSSSALRGKNKT